ACGTAWARRRSALRFRQQLQSRQWFFCLAWALRTPDRRLQGPPARSTRRASVRQVRLPFHDFSADRCVATQFDYCSGTPSTMNNSGADLNKVACGVSIAGHMLPNRAFLAPMAGITDRAMRRLAERFGAGLVVSEMIASAALSTGHHEMVRK